MLGAASHQQPGLHSAWIALLLGCVILAVYARVIGLPFLSEDFISVKGVALPDGRTNWPQVWEDLYTPFLNYKINIYRPLYTLSFALPGDSGQPCGCVFSGACGQQ
jgi:hypothetical protein